MFLRKNHRAFRKNIGKQIGCRRNFPGFRVTSVRHGRQRAVGLGNFAMQLQRHAENRDKNPEDSIQRDRGGGLRLWKLRRRQPRGWELVATAALLGLTIAACCAAKSATQARRHGGLRGEKRKAWLAWLTSLCEDCKIGSSAAEQSVQSALISCASRPEPWLEFDHYAAEAAQVALRRVDVGEAVAEAGVDVINLDRADGEVFFEGDVQAAAEDRSEGVVVGLFA